MCQLVERVMISNWKSSTLPVLPERLFFMSVVKLGERTELKFSDSYLTVDLAIKSVFKGRIQWCVQISNKLFLPVLEITMSEKVALGRAVSQSVFCFRVGPLVWSRQKHLNN